MRVLLLITDLLIGGTPTVVRELSWRLREQGVDVQVACLSKWGPTAAQIKSKGIKVTALDARGALDVGVFYRLARLIRAEQIDVVVSFLVHANVAAVVAKLAGKPFRLIQSIQTTQPRPRWHWWAQGLVQGAAECIVVPSASVAEMAQLRSGIAASRFVVIPNAVDGSEFVLSPKPSVGEFRVGFIGRLDPVKRICDLVEAMTYLPDDAHLNIWGEGPELERLRLQVSELGLSGRCHFRGMAERPQDALPEIDLLVLPSDAEGFGLVLIEAMAAGVPVVGTNVPGIRDVVISGVNGLLVPARSPRAIARAVESIRGDDAMRRMLVEQARRHVSERYGWGSVLAKYVSLISGVSGS